MRFATEEDIPRIIKLSMEMHKLIGGPLDVEHCSEIIRSCRSIVSEDGYVVGAEVPGMSSPEPILNHIISWHSKGSAWPLLEAHEKSSKLPTSLGVPSNHPRREALMRALRARGYREVETIMVQDV